MSNQLKYELKEATYIAIVVIVGMLLPIILFIVALTLVLKWLGVR